MKTSIELDDEKVKVAKRLSDAATLRQIVDEALDAYITKKRRDSMIGLLGANLIGPDYKPTRKARERPRR